MPDLFAFIFWILVLVFTVRLIIALGAGQLNANGVTFTRAASPPGYWFEIALNAWMVLASAVVLLVGRWAWPGLLGVLYGHHLARLVWYGEVHTWRGTFTRAEWPRRYWTEFGIYAFITIASLGLMVTGK